jgi:hypothetical protein
MRVLVDMAAQALHLVFLAHKFSTLVVVVDLEVLMVAQQSSVDLAAQGAVAVVEIAKPERFPVELIMLPALLVLPILAVVEEHLKVVLVRQEALES